MHRTLLFFLLLAAAATAQDTPGNAAPVHTPNMQMPASMNMGGGSSAFIELLQQHQGAGTDVAPATTCPNSKG